MTLERTDRDKINRDAALLILEASLAQDVAAYAVAVDPAEREVLFSEIVRCRDLLARAGRPIVVH